MSKMNTKMNKLALCALLSAGVLSAVHAVPTVDELLKMSSVELFNSLENLKGCRNTLKVVGQSLGEEESTQKREELIDLARELNSLCDFWEWFRAFDAANFQESDAKRIFSESVSRSEDLRDGRELVRLRDVGWGEGLKGKTKDKAQAKKFKALKSRCERFI